MPAIFDPRSSGNVAVYFGLPDSKGSTSLLETCANPNINIVILGFITDVTYGGSTYPRLQCVSFPSHLLVSTAYFLTPWTETVPLEHSDQPDVALGTRPFLLPNHGE